MNESCNVRYLSVRVRSARVRSRGRQRLALSRASGAQEDEEGNGMEGEWTGTGRHSRFCHDHERTYPLSINEVVHDVRSHVRRVHVQVKQ